VRRRSGDSSRCSCALSTRRPRTATLRGTRGVAARGRRRRAPRSSSSRAPRSIRRSVQMKGLTLRWRSRRPRKSGQAITEMRRPLQEARPESRPCTCSSARRARADENRGREGSGDELLALANADAVRHRATERIEGSSRRSAAEGRGALVPAARAIAMTEGNLDGGGRGEALRRRLQARYAHPLTLSGEWDPPGPLRARRPRDARARPIAVAADLRRGDERRSRPRSTSGSGARTSGQGDSRGPANMLRALVSRRNRRTTAQQALAQLPRARWGTSKGFQPSLRRAVRTEARPPRRS